MWLRKRLHTKDQQFYDWTSDLGVRVIRALEHASYRCNCQMKCWNGIVDWPPLRMSMQRRGSLFSARDVGRKFASGHDGERWSCQLLAQHHQASGECWTTERAEGREGEKQWKSNLREGEYCKWLPSRNDLTLEVVIQWSFAWGDHSSPSIYIYIYK